MWGCDCHRQGRAFSRSGARRKILPVGSAPDLSVFSAFEALRRGFGQLARATPKRRLADFEKSL
jgi:hypothetical protein